MGNAMPCCKEQQSTKQNTTPVPNPSKSIDKNLLKPLCPSEVASPLQSPSSIRAKVETTLRQDRRSRGPEQYQCVKILGKGSLGFVVLAEEKLTGRRFAMKMIPKAKINESNLLQTKLIPTIRKHPFLTTIYETFQNSENIYIVMEYMPKGDLFFYSQKESLIFSQAIIKDILAEIAVAIAFLHGQGIVYRVLKPENILVAEDGHIKLTDYGLSKVLLDNSPQRGLSTFIGAIQYMAPEVISQKYDQKVDLWAMGILAYELKFKENAIEHEGQTNYSIEDYEALLNKNFIQQKLNSKIGYMTQQFRDLLVKLLEKDPHTRLSLDQLRQHPFFEGVDWKQVEQRQNTPPFLEILKKNDVIKFRDPTKEESKRKEVYKRHCGDQKFSLNLFEVRISE